MIYSPDGLMRYNDSKAIVDDIPLLSQWIKKSRSEKRDFLAAPVRLELTTSTLAMPEIDYGLERLSISTAAPTRPSLHHPLDALGRVADNSRTRPLTNCRQIELNNNSQKQKDIRLGHLS